MYLPTQQKFLIMSVLLIFITILCIGADGIINVLSTIISTRYIHARIMYLFTYNVFVRNYHRKDYMYG